MNSLYIGIISEIYKLFMNYDSWFIMVAISSILNHIINEQVNIVVNMINHIQ